MGLFSFLKKKKAPAPAPAPPPPSSEFQYTDALGTEYKTTVNGTVQRNSLRLSQTDQANVNAAKEGSSVLINELGQSSYQLQQQRDNRQAQLFQANYNSLLDLYNQQASRTRAANAKRLGSASTNTFLGQQLLGLQQQTGRSINDAQLNAYYQAWSDQIQQQSSLRDRLGSLTNVLDFYQKTVLPYAQLGSANSADSQQLLLAQKKAIDEANSNTFKLNNRSNGSGSSTAETMSAIVKAATIALGYM